MAEKANLEKEIISAVKILLLKMKLLGANFRLILTKQKVNCVKFWKMEKNFTKFLSKITKTCLIFSLHWKNKTYF